VTAMGVEVAVIATGVANIGRAIVIQRIQDRNWEGLLLVVS